MKEGLHPQYYQATVTCNCGNTFVTGSTKKEIHVEVCSKCHPFYTGQQKAAKARGRIEAFNKKYGMRSANMSGITAWTSGLPMTGTRTAASRSMNSGKRSTATRS